MSIQKKLATLQSTVSIFISDKEYDDLLKTPIKIIDDKNEKWFKVDKNWICAIPEEGGWRVRKYN